MAEQALAMSLDDIIKKNSRKGDKPEKKMPEKAKGVPVGRKAKVTAAAASRAAKTDKLVKVVAKGGVAKKGRGATKFEAPKAVRPVRPAVQGGNGGPRGGVRPVGRKNDAVRRAALEGEGRWQHDLFHGSPPGQRRSNVQSRLGDAPGASGAKLFISNLDFKVTEQDIRELFEVYGRLRRVTVHYDRSGRAEGSADVVFEVKADALRAQERYNRVALDGKPMKIEVQAVGQQRGVIKTLSSGIRLTEAAGGGAGGGARGGGNQGARSGVQITRTLAQAANGSSRGGGGSGGNGGGQRSRPRVASRVVRGRGNVGSDYMEE